MAEAVKVIVRCRPMNSRENSLNCKVVVKMDQTIGQVSLFKPGSPEQPPKSFTFDGVYFMDSITENIYSEIVFPLVEGVIEGYNGTVFAYGQTGCGKSFSMQGVTDPPSQRGIIPRAFEHIFESIQTEENAKYLIHASYLEIYNEEIKDLMGKDHRAKLEVKEHPDRGVYVKDLSLIPCHTVEDMDRVMELGGKNRHVGATLMNADSSRSHSIFTIFVETSEIGPDGEEHIRAGKLNLVDLAGSERQAKTGASGDRLKEATKINLSLSALGNVISALVDGKSKHIPYRDSKLTRLLQDSLGGNTKTLMASCISPADNNYDETLSTLRYANRAKNIKNKPKINEDPKDALLRQYQGEIEMLKKMLMGQMEIDPSILVKLGMGGDTAPAAAAAAVVKPPVAVIPQEQAKIADKTAELAAQSDEIRKEYEEKIEKLQTMFEKEQSSKQKLQEELDKLEKEYSDKLDTVQEKYDHVSEAESIVAEFQARGDLEKIEESVGNNGEVAELEQEPSISKGQNGNATDKDIGIAVKTGATKAVGKIGAVANELKEEALKRLQTLQEQIVGGEKRNDQSLKEKRKARKLFAQSKREKLMKAVEHMEDDGIMVKVYDNLQEELKIKNKKISILNEHLTAAEIEAHDLQSEFERDRQDYLETIRKMEQKLQLQQQLLDKIQPCLRRDCNYYNLDKVKHSCEWDESLQKWILPDLVIEKTVLPSGVTPGGRGGLVGNIPAPIKKHPPEAANGEIPINYFEANDQDKFFKHLDKNTNEEYSASYFKPKRAEKLLQASSSLEFARKRDNESQQRLKTHDINGNITPNGGQKNSLPRSLEPIPRPAKLESLPPSAFQKKKKKKSQGHELLER